MARLWHAESMTTSDAPQLARVRGLAASGEAKRIRQDHKLSLLDVAKYCGVDASTVWRWESGRRAPRGSAALRYAQLLETLTAVTK